MSFLQNLQWRFATKQFNPERQVSSEDLDQILEAIRLAPSSLGLQPFQVLVVRNRERRALLQDASRGQSQVIDSSELLVFCCRTDIDGMLNDYLQGVVDAEGGDPVDYASLRQRVETRAASLSPEQMSSWLSRQVYIALGFALAACAELQIDSCPMEGFDPEEYKKILGLPDYLQPLVLLPIGYRAAEPKRKKNRIRKEALFTFID